jgi:hypothetical protein
MIVTVLTLREYNLKKLKQPGLQAVCDDRVAVFHSGRIGQLFILP